MKWQALTQSKHPHFVNVPEPENVRFEFNSREGELIQKALEEYSDSCHLILSEKIIVSTMALKILQIYSGKIPSGTWNYDQDVNGGVI